MLQTSQPDRERRELLKGALAVGAVGALSAGVWGQARPASAMAMPRIALVEPPYPANALEPYISERTINTHLNQHHKAYYEQVVGWTKGEEKYANMGIEELIQATRRGILTDESIHAMSILVWNHNLYWRSMKPGGGIPASPKGPLAVSLEKSYGSVKGFRDEFLKAALRTGVGWVWLVSTDTVLSVDRTDYHDSPVVKGRKALLTLDVWEHAYYLDYQADRKKYVENFLDHLLDWEGAIERMS